jgi:hypothetical protein
MPPTALIGTLETLRRRVRVLSVMYGVGILVSVAVALLLGTVLLDYVLNLPPIPRIVVMVIALACLAHFLTRWVIRPALTRLRLSDIAGKLEHAFPDFKDRLRSSVDFLTKGTPGSEAMKNRVVSEAAELAGRFDLSAAVRTKPMWEAFAAGGGAILILVLLGTFAGRDYLSPAISRLITPFANQPWPKRVEIQMVSDLPSRVPVGRPVDVRIRLIKGDRPSREARIYYQYGEGPTQTEIMTRGADGVYSASLDARIDSASSTGQMTIWPAAGDDSLAPRTIAIVQRLAVTGTDLVVQPPPYTDEPAAPVAFGSTPATVTYGSSVNLKLTFNKDLDGSRPPVLSSGEQGGPLPEIIWDAAAGNTITGHWIARDSSSFQMQAVDQDGFTSDDGAEYQIIVRPDQMPSVQITRPARNEECTLDAILPIRAMAEDDYGIKSLRLVVTKMADKPIPLTSIDLIADSNPAAGISWSRLEGAGDMRRWQLDYPWTLSQIPASPALKPGDVLEYHLEAQDNFAFEGKYHDVVSSGSYRITLMSQEQFNSLMNDLVGQVREQIKDIRNSQKGVKGETEDLHQQTASQQQFTRADKQQAQELVARQATIASETKQAAGKLDDLVARMAENQSTAHDLMEMASSVRDDLTQVAEHPMKDAASQVDQARDPRQDANSRNSQLASAESNQQDAADQLDQMISRMGDAGGLSQTIEQIKAILNQQRQISQASNDTGLRNLGKTPDQMSTADQKAQQANADAQAALANQTAKTLEKMQQNAQQLAKTDPDASQAMQQAAQTGQQQGVPAQMQASADAQRQNQQASAQQAQAQVEVGLQTIIHQLEEAQRRKLEALARQLADIQQQIANLLRQQSGLNYDNMALRGPGILKQADGALIDHLLELAERDKAQLPPTPDIDTQTRLQEQTERNTRGVSKSAESLPEGSAIVSNLNRAADRMGRAISALRADEGTDAQHLAAAYDPPQVEALAALEQAKTVIDQQAAKANQALEQQRKDAIRAVYEKLLASQKKIDADTQTVDQAPRNPDGQLAHREAILLDELPPRQGTLADTTAKLEDDLAGLNSVVYVWANHDIVESMNSVKTLLTKPQTDVVTQAEQTRIEDQLRAMIDSLMVKPKQIPFASKGGGSGQCKPGLPTEAELRLEKALQQAVNRSTVTVSKSAGNQDPVLLALGDRQLQLRNVLDQLIQKASHGQSKLGPEPDPKNKLPEEANSESVDNDEMMQNLLKGDGSPTPDPEKDDLNLVGERMARSHQRLSLEKDPGPVTQDIQNRILQNLDALIDQARTQEAEQKQQPKPQQSQQAQASQRQSGAAPQNNNPNGQQARSAGHTAAAVSVSGHDVSTDGTPTTDITQSMKEWGDLSPRQRAAVIEAGTEKPVQKFKEFIDEYYQALGNQQSK